MKGIKLALVLVIPVVALLLLGRSVQTPTAEAKPTAIVTLNPTLCLTLTLSLDWNNDTVVDDADSAVALSACNTGLADEGTMGDLIRILDGDPDDPQPEDFADIDVEGGQIHETDGKMWFIAFVTNDEPIGFYADEGNFPISGIATLLCGPMAMPGYDFEEEDCDDDGDRGDGMVAVMLLPGDGDRGESLVRVRQGGLEIEEAYSIVGEPWNIELAATESTIQTGAVSCEMFDSLDSFVAVLNAPEKTALNATVKDDDGTVLTAALVGYATDDPDKATPLLPLVPTLESALGVGAPNVLCGVTDAGTVEITASILKAVPDGGPTLEPGSRERHDSVEVTVVDPPEDMVLSVSPASIVCDGVTGATVSAALTDADGNPAIDGNRVRFDVRVLGTANPIEATSVAGTATTTVTPLSGIARGVTVKATLLLPFLPGFDGDEDILVSVVEKNILVECTEAAPVAPAPPPAAPSTPAISPPRTGDGGYLP